MPVKPDEDVMKMPKPRAILRVLILALCIEAFAGCARTAKPATVMAYIPENVALPEEYTKITSVYVNGDEVYFLARVTDGADVCKMTASGDNVTKLPKYTAPEGMTATAMCLDDNGAIWVAETAGGAAALFRKLDALGAELTRLDVTDARAGYSDEELSDEEFLIENMEIDGGGNIYALDSARGLKIFSDKGVQRAYLRNDVNGWTHGLIKLGGGEVRALRIEDISFILLSMDPVSGNRGASSALSVGTRVLFSGDAEYPYYYSDGISLYGGGAKGEENGKPLFKWFDADIPFESVTSLAVASDGAVFCASSFGKLGGGSNAELYILTEREIVPTNQKITLRLAFLGTPTPELVEQVAAYNRTNMHYKIEMETYITGAGIYSPEFNLYWIDKFNLEIVSGKPPDIVIAPGILPEYTYIAKGAFEDLYPYLESDLELGWQNAIVPDVLRVMEYDGGLYQIPTGFSIVTYMGPEEIFGDMESWTPGDALALLESYPGAVAVSNMTAESALGAAMYDIYDYVDFTAGECYFDSEDFIGVLEFAKSFPNKKLTLMERIEMGHGDELVIEGKALTTSAAIEGFLDHQKYKAVMGEGVRYVGFPSENGCGATFAIRDPVAISSASRYKDAAWEFVRTLLTEDYQTRSNSNGLIASFPTNARLFERLAEDAMKKVITTDADGREREEVKREAYWYGRPIQLYAATPEDIALVRELMSKIDGVIKQDDKLLNIITEEAEPFFAGQVSAEEAARVIQSRAAIYVSERDW